MKPSPTLVPRLTPLFRHLPALPTLSAKHPGNDLDLHAAQPQSQSGWGRWWISHARDNSNSNLAAQHPQPNALPNLTTSPLLQHTLTHTPRISLPPNTNTTFPHAPPPPPAAAGPTTEPKPSLLSKATRSKRPHRQREDEDSAVPPPPPTIAWFDHLSMV